MNQISVQSDQNRLLDEQIAKAKVQLEQFKDAGSSGKDQQKVLEQDAAQVNEAAGLTEVSGPGISITMQRNGQVSQYYDPQQDLSFIVNILFSDGADAIAIDGQRLTTTSTIRDISNGAYVLVNGQPATEPYTIVAKGDVKNMLSVLDVAQIVPEMDKFHMETTVTQSTKVTVPGYTGQMPGLYAKEVTGQ